MPVAATRTTISGTLVDGRNWNGRDLFAFSPAGAVATSHAHDSHNLAVIGRDRESMATAANAVIAAQGGIAVTVGSDVGRAVGTRRRLHGRIVGVRAVSGRVSRLRRIVDRTPGGALVSGVSTSGSSITPSAAGTRSQRRPRLP